jgi:hypothetical protein
MSAPLRVPLTCPAADCSRQSTGGSA